MARLLVFNPDHDYALAHGGAYYCPPAPVVKLARELYRLPACWGEEGDYVLRPDGMAESIGCGAPERVEALRGRIESVEPWGWNAALKHRLVELGCDLSLLPDDEELEKLRRLSHRRISISCNEALGSPLVPKECFSEEEAMDFRKENPGCYFKMPWSSGGRGVIATEEVTEEKTREWVRGSIRRQGSVMAERRIDRKLDFATLWNIDPEGTVMMEGLSVFRSDGRGKYGGNLREPQARLQAMIREAAPTYSEAVAERQKRFIEEHIAPHYRGKLGIDMAVDSAGTIYPCVELNLRRTMGHVALEEMRAVESET